MTTLKKGRPKFEHVIFLDRTHGKKMAALLRKVGIKVRSIYQVYPKKKHEKVLDPTWIEMCAKNGWVAVTGDKRLEKNVVNLAAVVQHKAKVFILTDTNSRPEEWAAAVIVGQDKMINVINKNPGPFFSTIQRRSRGHVSDPRFPKSQAEGSNETRERQQESQDTAQFPAHLASSAGNSAGEKAEEKGKGA